MTTLREAALAYYHGRGWTAHPLTLNAAGLPKVPLTDDWPHIAPTEAAIAALDWRHAKGIGLVLGSVSGNLAVIDVDD